MEISIKEKFLLLSLEDKKGKRERGSYFFNIGFSACILLEMVISDHLEIRKGLLYLKKTRNHADPVYNEVIRRMLKPTKNKSIKHWISNLNMASAKFKKQVIKALVYKGILRKEKHRFLFFNYFLYPTLNSYPENEFRKELVAGLNDPNSLEEGDVALLAILDASKLLQVLFSSKEETKNASNRIKEMATKNQFGEAVSLAMQEMQAAIVSTVVLSAAVS